MKAANSKTQRPCGAKSKNKKRTLEGDSSKGPSGLKRKVGRPSLYTEIKERLDEIEELAGFGLTVEQIASFLKVNPDTLYTYQKKYPDFSETLKRGKVKSDTRVKRSLFERANGYEHEEDKIFLHEGEPVIVPTVKHYPPDTAAAFIWLKNRCGWQDRLDMKAEVTTKPPIDYKKLSTPELKNLQQLLEKAKPDESDAS